MASNFYKQYGFDVEITVGSYLLDTTLGYNENGLCNELRVSASEGGSRTATFSFIPPEADIDLQQFQGKKVTIKERAANGWFQIFDGWVDVPAIEFMTGKITLDCTDRRQTRIDGLSLGTVQSVGTYSDAVFGTPKNSSEELDKRLQTVAASFDFDGYGNYHLTPWLPKASADFTLTPADVQYNSNPQLSYSNRDKTVNTININVDYRYQRLHQQACHFTWTGFTDFIDDYWEAGKPSFPAIQTIDSAVKASEWKVVSANDVTYTALWPAQGFPYGDGFIIWQPNDVIEEKAERKRFVGYLKDSSGNFVTVGFPARLSPQYETVLDSAGKPIMDVIRRTIIDNSSHLCRAASWSSARRFAQTAIERYEMTLKAPQAQSANTVIEDNVSISIDDPFDTSNWEQGKEISFTSTNFYVNKKLNYSKLFQAMGVCLNKARHDILAAHRDLTITFRTGNLKHRPEIDLHHTVDVTIDQSTIGRTKSIHAVGKVSGVTHYVDFSAPLAYSMITLKLSMAAGSTTNDIWAVQQPVEDYAYIGEANTVALKTHISLDPVSDPNYNIKTGWFCNGFQTNSANVTSKTTFPEAFKIDFPEIPESLRNEIVFVSDDNVFNLVIPNDIFEVHT